MKGFFFALLIVLLSTPLVRAQAHDSHVAAALKLVDLGNARQAAEDLRALVAQDPKNAEAHAGLAIALANLNQTKEALSEAQTGFDLDRHDVLVRVARGIAYGKLGRVEDALNEFHEALNINGKDIGAMVALSHYYISIDSLKPAEITLYQAQQVNDKDIRPYLGLAELYERQNIPDLAISQYQQAMKLDPNDARVHAALAGLYLRTYKYDESIKEWLKVVQIDSTYADAYRQIANLYMLAKLYPDAARFAKTYTELKPKDLEGQWLYAQALAMSGAYKEALPALEAVSANDSLRPLAQMLLARSYFYAKQYPKALEIYRNATSLSPSDLSFYGDALVVTGDTAGGIEQLKKSLATDTVAADRIQTESAIGNLLYAQKRYAESAQIFANMANEQHSATDYLSAGQIFGLAKMPDSARFYDNKALALDPNSLKVRTQIAMDELSAGPASDTALAAFASLDSAAKAQNQADTAAIAEGFMGYHYAALKDWKSSIEHLQPSVDALENTNSPYRVSFMLLLGQSYHQLQQLDKAKEYYEKVLKLDPENAGAKQGLDYIKGSPAEGKKRRK